MTGLSSDNAAQEQRFLQRVQEYRERLRNAVEHPHSIAAHRHREARDLEIDLDHLLMEAANLAREPLLRHMAVITQCAAALVPSPFVTYPDPKKGAES